MNTVTPSVQRSSFGQTLFEALNDLPGSKRLTGEQLEVIYALGYAHLAQDQYAQALPLFAFLSQYGPTRRHYLMGLAICLHKLGRFDEAIRIYSLVGVLYPDAFDATLFTAQCMLAADQAAEARATLELLIAGLPAGGEYARLATQAQQLLKQAAAASGH